MKRKETPSSKAIKNSEVRAHLEAITGSKIDPALGISPVQLFYMLGTVVQTQGFNNVTTVVTYKNLILSDAIYENLAPSVDVSGVSTTGSNGNVVFTVMSVAPYEIQKLSEPVHIVATPHGSAPSFLTVEHVITGDSASGDVQITVYAWDSNGNPAPNVAFDWRCRLNGLIVELLD